MKNKTIDSKKKIGLLIGRLQNGGAERAVANLSKMLAGKYDVHIMVLDSSVIDYPYEGTLHTLGVFPATTRIGKIINFIRRGWQVYKCKRNNQIPTTISFMPLFNFYNVMTKGKGKAICSIRTVMSLQGCSKLWSKCLTWCGKKADITVSVSEMARQDLIKHFAYDPAKIITILNLCNPAALQTTNPQINKLTQEFHFNAQTIVTVGRLEFEKAQWHLLRAFSLVLQTNPQAQLVLFGQGSLEPALKEYAKRLGIEKNTYFMGYVRNQHTFLRQCDVFVLSSFAEGISNALLEAMACGLPIISTDCQCEILSDKIHDINTVEYAKWGVLVPGFTQTPFNVDDTTLTRQDMYLAQAIQKLLNDPALSKQYRAQSSERIKDFSPQAIVKQWIDVIEK